MRESANQVRGDDDEISTFPIVHLFGEKIRNDNVALIGNGESKIEQYIYHVESFFITIVRNAIVIIEIFIIATK